jgi:hypothetical protein
LWTGLRVPLKGCILTRKLAYFYKEFFNVTYYRYYPY